MDKDTQTMIYVSAKGMPSIEVPVNRSDTIDQIMKRISEVHKIPQSDLQMVISDSRADNVSNMPKLHDAKFVGMEEHSRNCTLILSDGDSGKALADPELLVENIQTKKFVLIHGDGFGAWCWYKTFALLEEAGLQPVALDLTGSGIDLTDSNNVTTLAEYSKPLTVYLENLPEDEKVILVGHSIGGSCISYALEHYPHKISKAIFLCATMVTNGKRPFDVFADQLGSAEQFMQESKFLIHGNGKEKPPTGFMFEKEQMKGLYFNQSSAKDVAEKYGTARRFYIQTLDDRALSPDVQEKLVGENPPEGVFKIKVSDHCPFFSKPQSLHKILVEIAQIQQLA